MKPFRWNLAKKEQLGKLIEGERAETHKSYDTELKQSAAKLLAFSKNAKLIFVGRSPENYYDYLSGVLTHSSYQNKLHYLNMSNRYQSIKDLKLNQPQAYQALKNHFAELGISPQSILEPKQKICFVDLVSSGGTFEALFEFMQSWTNELNLDFKQVKAKISFLGITYRTKNSPNTWRWQQRASWVKEQQVKNIKNLSISADLWHYLGNWQDKVSPTNPPEKWASDSILLPSREEQNLKALRRAYDLYSQGQNETTAFSSLLSQEDAMKEVWFRQLLNDLRKTGNSL